jgi:hypothetical protein
MGRSNQNLRSLRQAAQALDIGAAKVLLRLYGFSELAAQIKTKPRFIPPRCRRMIDALCAGTGEGAAPKPPWEFVNDRGEIENLILTPPPPRRTRARVFEDEDPPC